MWARRFPSSRKNSSRTSARPTTRPCSNTRPTPKSAALAARTPALQGAIARYADLRAPGARTSAIARTAFIDNVVRRALSAGVTQVVILGAGYDTRAQRMPELGRAHVFEVDRQPTQENKLSLLGTTRSVYVPVDFLKDDAFARLASGSAASFAISPFAVSISDSPFAHSVIRGVMHPSTAEQRTGVMEERE